jgi:hypothetical protein
MHSYHVQLERSFLVRMMAIRESVVGGLLITVEDAKKQDKGRKCAYLTWNIPSMLTGQQRD